MLVHYFHQLAVMNRCTFIIIAGAMSRFTELKSITDKVHQQGILSAVILFLYPIINWMAIRFPHHSIFSLAQPHLLVHCILGVIDGPMTYFYDFIRPGI